MITPMIRKTRSPGHMVVDGSKTTYFTVLTLFMGNSLAAYQRVGPMLHLDFNHMEISTLLLHCFMTSFSLCQITEYHKQVPDYDFNMVI